MRRRISIPCIRLCLCACCLLLVADRLHAQGRTGFLSFVGYEFGVPQSIQREPGTVNLTRFQTEGLGYSTNHTLRFGLGYAPGMLRVGPVSTQFRLLLSSSSGRFTSDPYNNGAGTVDTTTIPETPISTRNEFEVLADESQIRLEGIAEWNGPQGIRFGIGPWIGYRISSSISQNERILSPGSTVFASNHSTERIVSAGDPITSFPWRFGGLLAVAREFPLGSGIRLRPELFTEFDNEALLDKKLGVRAFSVGMNLGVAFDFSPAISPPLPPADTMPLPPRLPSLVASIDLYNADRQSTPDEVVVISQSTVSTSYLPLLPAISFEPGQTDLPPYLHRLSPNRTTEFAENHLADQGLEELRAHLLNIVGERMSRNRKGRLILFGSEKGKERNSMARERMEGVRRYLLEIWKIDSTQVSIDESPNEGQEGTVRLAADDPAILAPVVQRWTSQKHKGPRVGLQKSIEAEEEIEEWEVSLRFGDSLIGRYSSRDGEEMKETIGLSFAGLEHSGEKMFLEAELKVTDRIGSTVVVRDRLNVLHRFAPDEKNETRTWLFLDPAVESSLEAINQAFVQSVAATARDGVRLMVESDPSAKRGEWSRERIAQKILAALVQEDIAPGEIIVRESESPSSLPTGGVWVSIESGNRD